MYYLHNSSTIVFCKMVILASPLAKLFVRALICRSSNCPQVELHAFTVLFAIDMTNTEVNVLSGQIQQHFIPYYL